MYGATGRGVHCLSLSTRNTKKVLLLTVPVAGERKLMKPGLCDLDTQERERERKKELRNNIPILTTLNTG
jgi:hypothetical protein